MAEKTPIVPAPVDVYDEEFFANLNLAKGLMSQLPKDDRDICKKWISKLVNMKSDDPVVKKNRNAFFKYMLTILGRAVNDAADKMVDEGRRSITSDANQYMCKWSDDKRTYIAAKPLPGLGTLVYMAVSKDINLGWDHPASAVEE